MSNSNRKRDETPTGGSSLLKLRHLRRHRSSERPDQDGISSRDQAQSDTDAKADNEVASNGSTEPNSSAEANIPSVPPDGGRVAWTQVFASFLINMNVYGFVNAFGEFQHFYETEYLVNYNSSTISWIGTVQGSLTLFVGALAGPIFDRGYFLTTLQCATAGLVVSWMLLSVCTEYYQVRFYKHVIFMHHY